MKEQSMGEKRIGSKSGIINRLNCILLNYTPALKSKKVGFFYGNVLEKLIEKDYEKN